MINIRLKHKRLFLQMDYNKEMHLKLTLLFNFIQFNYHNKELLLIHKILEVEII